jgi:hypothetical protein
MCAITNKDLNFPRKIIALLNEKRVIETDSLREMFHDRSRRSIFRDLSCIDYISSITHAGRYITLPHIPKFDEHGLWFFNNIGFSKDQSVKDAICRVVNGSDAGKTHEELKNLFHVRIHNALVELMRRKKLSRVPFGSTEWYLYLSADEPNARLQLEKRNKISQAFPIDQTISPLVAIKLLVEVIKWGGVLVDASAIHSRMRSSDVNVTIEQVNYLIAHYGIGVKKTTHHR